MVRRIAATQARDDFASLLNQAAYGHEQIILHRRGKDLAALIPIEDLDLLQRLVEEEEDRIDIELADQALAEMKAKGEKPIPLEVVERKIKKQWAARRKKRSTKA